MIEHSPQFAQALFDRIQERYEKKRAELAAGNAADFPDYRHRVGYVTALSHVLDYFEETRKQLTEPAK